MPENPYRSPQQEVRGTGVSRFRFLDVWFLLFPVWSTLSYAWCFLYVPLDGGVSPLMPPDSPHYISPTAFGLFFVVGLAILATLVFSTYLLTRSKMPSGKQIVLFLLALAVPPIGCTIAYFECKRYQSIQG